MKYPAPCRSLFRHAHLLCAILVAGFGVLGATGHAYAGGGGHNMLLVVNPGDEHALRIASAYQQLRQIPDANILMIEPPKVRGRHVGLLTQQEFVDLYAKPIQTFINDRGLGSQIDYIGALGQPWRIKNPHNLSMSTALAEIPQLATIASYNGYTDITQGAYGFWQLQYDRPLPAMHSRDSYMVATTRGPEYRNYYMGGLVGFTGPQGMTAQQAIASLTYAASGDGQKPVGTVYFEENDDVRSNTRESQWPVAKTYLSSIGVPWVESRNTAGYTPRNRSDVRGAVVGRASITLPNGSTYLPGSWGDHVTSYGGAPEVFGHTMSTEWLKVGVAATSGTIVEPTSDPKRFPHAMVHGVIAAGGTMGEAFARTVAQPYLTQLYGDLLAQPYAHLPSVNWTTVPENAAVVSGQVVIGAQAQVTPDAVTRTQGIRRLELYIDGRLADSSTNAGADFALDTTGLSDGWHELRVVAITDSSLDIGRAIVRHVQVSNQGRSVSASGAGTVSGNGAASYDLNVQTGGAVGSRVELRHLGRTIATAGGSAASISLDAAHLAYGDNTVYPVVVFEDGSETVGAPLSVRRDPVHMPGRAATPGAFRTPGVEVAYYLGKGGARIDEADFSGDPDIVTRSQQVHLAGNGTFLPYSPTTHPTSLVNRLGVQITGSFLVDAAQAGEYQFWLYRTNDSARLSIDGMEVLEYDGAVRGGSNLDLGGVENQLVNVFLAPGEHDFLLETTNLVESGSYGTYYDISLWLRGPDGVTRRMDSSIAYTIPEPASVVGLALLALIGRRRRG